MNLNPFRRAGGLETVPREASGTTETGVKLIVYGTKWCGDCHRSRRFLDRHVVPYEWVDVEDNPAATDRVLTINKGRRSVPTIIFPDGSTLTEPSNSELAAKLGLSS